MTSHLQPEAGQLGPTSPAWLLRILLAAVCCLTLATTVRWTSANAFYVVLLAGCAALVVGRPASHAATGFLGVVMFVVLVHDPGLSAWTMAAVLGVHATHGVAALAAVAPWDAALERAVLWPPARRFVLIQAASQTLVLLALLVTP